MIGLLQRVTEASVTVDGEIIGAIERGLMVLVGVERNDTEVQADKLLTRLLGYRVFADADDKMNFSLKDVQGGLLLVPQFTLAANTQKGARPSFSSAATPDQGRQLFDYLLSQAQQWYPKVASGRFVADLQVARINEGSATFRYKVN